MNWAVHWAGQRLRLNVLLHPRSSLPPSGLTHFRPRGLGKVPEHPCRIENGAAHTALLHRRRRHPCILCHLRFGPHRAHIPAFAAHHTKRERSSGPESSRYLAPSASGRTSVRFGVEEGRVYDLWKTLQPFPFIREVSSNNHEVLGKSAILETVRERSAR
jgi:hypothetical protein